MIVEGKEVAADLTHRLALADVEHDHGLPGRCFQLYPYFEWILYFVLGNYLLVMSLFIYSPCLLWLHQEGTNECYDGEDNNFNTRNPINQKSMLHKTRSNVRFSLFQGPIPSSDQAPFVILRLPA